MDVQVREAALCVLCDGPMFLVAEIVDPQTGARLHRPPGGGICPGETPEQAVRRELSEELGITLGQIDLLGAIEHTWRWNGREVRERAWIFVTQASKYLRLWTPGPPWIIEDGGDSYRTLWRSVHCESRGLPELCPTELLDLLQVNPSDRELRD